MKIFQDCLWNFIPGLEEKVSLKKIEKERGGEEPGVESRSQEIHKEIFLDGGGSIEASYVQISVNRLI